MFSLKMKFGRPECGMGTEPGDRAERRTLGFAPALATALRENSTQGMATKNTKRHEKADLGMLSLTPSGSICGFGTEKTARTTEYTEWITG